MIILYIPLHTVAGFFVSPRLEYTSAMRKKLIAANWKMNTTLAEAHLLADGVRGGAEHIEKIDIVLFPPTIWLLDLAHNIPAGALPHLSLGGQNAYFEAKGAFTGETSPAMLKEVVDYVLVGHSERTHVFHEDADLVAKKLRAAFQFGLKPILCIGEDMKGQNQDVAARLSALVAGLTPEQLQTLVVAYEPVWAIGSGDAADPAYAQAACVALRAVLTPETRILYGGSVIAENAKSYLQEPDIDGLLVGGASLNLKGFLTICQQADDL